jgi:hypothetical protein
LKPEEFKAKTEELLQNHTDQAKISTILAELNDDYIKEMTEKTTALTTAEKLVADNEKLRSANMNLFLKIGEPKKEEQKTTPEDNTPKYESLFDENGNLK